MAEFRMPSLGADMEEGTLTEWRVAPGDRVHRGDVVASVDTSKAEIEIEIFQDGEIERLLVEPGTRVPVGAPLATFRTADGAAPEAPAQDAPTSPAPVPSPPTPLPVSPPAMAQASPAQPPTAPVPAPMPPEPALPAAARIAATSPGAASGTRLRVSPLARRVAGRLGIDLAAVRGTGRGRAVTLADVEQAAGARQAAEAAPAVAVSQAPAGAPVRAPAAAPTAPIAARPPDRATAMRQATGALMARSKREIPHYYLETTIDLGAALDWLAAGNVGLSPARRLIPAALLLAATARAARAVPRMNGFFLDGEVQEAERIHLGVAIALRGGGLVAPALHDADTATPAELMAALAGTTTRARTGMLRASEMTDATLTVTNLGELGADKVNGVIHPPQIALVGFGAIRRRPWVVDGALTIRPLVVATLAADHRASDGQDGSRFLAKLDALLQRPEAL